MKKILIDAYLEKNLGDDLFVKILLEKYPNVEWYINAQKEYSEIFRNYGNIKILNDSILKKIINRFDITKKILMKIQSIKYDALMIIGGSLFMEDCYSDSVLGYRKKIISLFNKRNKKIFILGANFGPYKTKGFLENYKKVFYLCDDVCFRDKYSFELFSDMNNIRCASDIVFQLNSEIVNKIKNNIGISIINLKNREGLKNYKEDYENKIVSLLEYGCKINKKFTLFSFCEYEGDLESIENIMNKINKKYISDISIVNYNGDIDYFIKRFSEMENMIGTRFHSIILSQLFNQNIFPIIYNEKSLNTLKDLGLHNIQCDIKDFCDMKEEDIINKMNNNKICCKEIIENSKKQFNKFEMFLMGNKNEEKLC